MIFPFGTAAVFETEVGGNNYIESIDYPAPSGHLSPGTYDLPIMYVTSHRICASLSAYAFFPEDPRSTIPQTRYFFGHHYTEINDDGMYHWCS
jgi:hypothetical protein